MSQAETLAIPFENAPTADNVSAASSTLLTGHRLTIARVIWVIIFVGLLTAFVIDAPFYFATMSQVCPEGCGLNEKQAMALNGVGISTTAFAWIALSLNSFIVLVSTVLALILFWRRSHDWMVLLVALFLVAYPTMNNGTTGNLPTNVPVSLWVLLQVLLFPVWIIYDATFLLFPNGRFVPHWTWILFIVWAVWGQLINFMPDLGEGLLFMGYPLFSITIIVLQIYRYRRASTPVQRQQTKWALTGLVAVLLANQLFWLPSGFTPLGNTLYMPASFLFYQLVILALPATFFIAIRRYRLYDIDTIIHRTLVYGSVTVVLAAIYVGCIVGLQAVSRTLLGGRGNPDEPITIVISTLLIAALFQPLRRGVQRAVDRRFYRTKYDARKAVEAFGATLRQEVDLADLHEHLLGVVQQTMEPAHLSLWLSDASQLNDRPALESHALRSR